MSADNTQHSSGSSSNNSSKTDTAENDKNLVDEHSPVHDRRQQHVKHKRPDPTRYGDWEKNGRCIDF